MKTFDYLADVEALNQKISTAMDIKPIVADSAALDWYESILDLMQKRDELIAKMLCEFRIRIECHGIDIEHRFKAKEHDHSQE